MSTLAIPKCLWLDESPAAVDFDQLELVFERRLHLVNPFTHWSGTTYSNRPAYERGYLLSRYAIHIADGSLDESYFSHDQNLETDIRLVLLGSGARELCCQGKIGRYNPGFTWSAGAKEKFLRELQVVIAKGTIEQAEDYEVYMASSFWPNRDDQGYVSYKKVAADDVPTATSFLTSWKHNEHTLGGYWDSGDE